MDVEILRLTKGVGVDAVVNANTEKQLKESSTCLNKYGFILRLCDSKADTIGKMGTTSVVFPNSIPFTQKRDN